ncbi:Flp pilus assembly protein CpaB [Thioclava sp. FR2]|uniref:Flp pilus assembly protein CpaB n=1 Tax=Thioclava sp. FR2 TaxID=3445780 RepID=UPI003EB7E4E2
MRAMFGLVLVAGVGLAGSAVYMAKGYIGQTQSALEQQQQMLAKLGPITQVYVMKEQKNYGDPLTIDDVELVYWPKNSLPEGAFNDAAVLFPPGTNQERFMLRTTEKFEPILEVKITRPGEPPGLTGQLAKGMRAFAVKVDAVSGVSGWVQPGDYVDINWTGSVNGMNGELTRLIESSTKVIAVDQQAGAQSSATVARTVIVAATPAQVARLTQAQATGRLTLSLVGSAADAVEGLVEVDSNSLLGITQEEVVVKQEAKRCTIFQNKGGERVEVEIPCTN